MKTTSKIVIVILLSVFCFQNSLAQEESRYEISLNIDFAGSRTKLKVSNISYSLNTYVAEPNPLATVVTPTKQEPTYVSATTNESLPKDFFKIFESNKNKINGFVEVKDNFGKVPTRKIEFKNSAIQISENLSNYVNGNTTSITIYGSIIIIDGISIFSK